MFAFPPLKMPEIACMKVFFPFGPLLLFPDELMLLLFPPDIEEEEVAATATVATRLLSASKSSISYPTVSQRCRVPL